MKLETFFNNFLKNVVNLNETRYKTAKSGVETITSILKNDELFGDKFIDAKPQGSFRQETIIKPVDSDIDFDVDILFEMDAVDDWEPADYLNKLSAQLKKLDRYKDKVDTRGKTRCVTIDYESDFHIDIVPTVDLGAGSVVMNKATNQYELTDGDGYAQWFFGKNSVTGKKYLTKTVRLLKYIRDSKNSFDVKSVVLTTLLGNQVLGSDKPDDHYSDLPTSFVRLLSRLDIYLQMNPSVPAVLNPVLSSENFNRHLDQAKYSRFRESVHLYAHQALDAYKEADEAQSLKKWQKIFGELFTGATTENLSLVVSINGLQLADFRHKQELGDVDILVSNSSATVRIEADLYWGRANDRVVNRRHKGSFSQKTELPRHHWLKYGALTTYDKPYDVYWQIVNTGGSASRANGLRGEIKKGTNEQWERSLYTGVHWIECFIIDSTTNKYICQSGPFYVGFREKPGDEIN